MYRDNFSDPATVEEVYTVQDVSPVADKKGKLPAPKATQYEAFISLLDCPPSPKPSDDGSLSDVDQSSVVSLVTEETERLDPGGTCMLRRGREMHCQSTQIRYNASTVNSRSQVIH